MITDHRFVMVAVAATLVFGGCNPDEKSGTPDARTGAVAESSSGATPMGPAGDSTMANMAGMEDMSAAAMDSMKSRIGMMKDLKGEQLKAMMTEHRQMAGNLLSQMNSDMKKMNMTWSGQEKALADSVRQDIIAIPTVPIANLPDFMARHGERMLRLMDSHRSMMSKMKM